MKLFWDQSELELNFTLNAEETKLLAKRTDTNKLGLAILLKYVQLEHHFPKKRKEIPIPLIKYVADQLKIPAEKFKNYSIDINRREIQRHRIIIRDYCNIKEWNKKYIKDIFDYLKTSIFPNKMEIEDVRNAILNFLYENLIEPPNPKPLTRIINSLIHSWENIFFERIYSELSSKTKKQLDNLLISPKSIDDIKIAALRHNIGTISTASFKFETRKLQILRNISLKQIIPIFEEMPIHILKKYKNRIMSEPIREIKRHPARIRYAFLAIFVYIRRIETIDYLIYLLIEIVQRIKRNGNKKAEQVTLHEGIRLKSPRETLYNIFVEYRREPHRYMDDVLPSIVSEEVIDSTIVNYELEGISFKDSEKIYMLKSFYHYRQIIPILFDSIEFNSNNLNFKPVIEAIELIKKYSRQKIHHYPNTDEVKINGIVSFEWNKLVIKNGKVRRSAYELCLLLSLRDKIRCREIWITDSEKYRNPDKDIPQDFEEKRPFYLENLQLPKKSTSFVSELKKKMHASLESLNKSIPSNPNVEILPKRNGWIKVSPLIAQPEPVHLGMIKEKILEVYNYISLLDIFKEVNHRIKFTRHFRSLGQREILSRDLIEKRLLLTLYALGTNVGIKRIGIGSNEHFDVLNYIKRRYVYEEPLRSANIDVANANFEIRLPHIWGKPATACASDSKRFGSWNQNIMTQWVNRFRGPVVKIYWHVEKKATCVYSQLQSCSASEVIAMIEGFVRHQTEMNIEKQYVDSHGQSLLAFAICHLLGLQLLPRLKGIHAKKLFRPYKGKPDAYPHLNSVMSRPIDWDLIQNQYDEIIKYVTAIKLNMASVESILKRFTKNNIKHPTYRAFMELGKVIRTIFMCDYLEDVTLRQEIHEGLNTIELWNGINDFIFFGKGGEFATNQRFHQEISVQCLHLVQNSMVYFNTLIIQAILQNTGLLDQMTEEDFRGLTPLFCNHINPYGVYNLDMEKRFDFNIQNHVA